MRKEGKYKVIERIGIRASSASQPAPVRLLIRMAGSSRMRPQRRGDPRRPEAEYYCRPCLSSDGECRRVRKDWTGAKRVGWVGWRPGGFARRLKARRTKPRDTDGWAVKRLKGGGRECRGTAGVSRRRVFVIRKRTKMLWYEPGAKKLIATVFLAGGTTRCCVWEG